MLQFIHLTAAYSNAVLTAILPHISDYSKKLDLPVSQPVTMSQVAHFGVNNIQGVVGGGIWLTNHYWFAFEHGYVDAFRLNTNNPFLDDDPAANWPKYAFGNDNMTTNEAIQLVRDAISGLGYTTNTFPIGIPPTRTTGPYDSKDGHHIPYTEIEWENKNTNMDNSYSIRGQVDLEHKKLIALSIISRKAWKPNPPVSITPELESDFRKRAMKPMTLNTNAPAHLQFH